jgi:hypothetical protein
MLSWTSHAQTTLIRETIPPKMGLKEDRPRP